MKNKKRIFIVVYALLLIIELFFYVPYEEIEIFRSDQNVPHTEIIGNGYIPLDEIRKDRAWLANNEETTTGKRVDSGQLTMNLFSTTIIALLIHFIFIYSEDKIHALKNKNKILRKKVKLLYYDSQHLKEYKTMFLQIKYALVDIANTSSMKDITKSPTIDIDSLTFADEEEQEAAFNQYTNDISAYTAYKIYKAIENNKL